MQLLKPKPKCILLCFKKEKRVGASFEHELVTWHRSI